MIAVLPALRSADWLNLRRAKAYRAILLIVTLLIAVGWLLTARNGQDATGKAIGTDFVAFWAAGGLAKAGTPGAGGAKKDGSAKGRPSPPGAAE